MLGKIMSFGQRWKDGALLSVGVGIAALSGAFIGLFGTGAVFIILEIVQRGRDWADIEDHYFRFGEIVGIVIFGPVFLSQAMDVLVRNRHTEH